MSRPCCVMVFNPSASSRIPFERLGYVTPNETAFHLRHRVEKADEQHEHDGDLAEQWRVESALGKIRNGVGAEAAQWPGDKQEQEQITTGVTDRIPERVVTARHDHASHTHE